MKILVTGASGFAGSHLIEALKAKRYTDIYGTVFGGTPFVDSLLPKNQLLHVDLTNKQAIIDLIKTIKPDWIFHLASLSFVGESFDRAEEVLSNNTLLQLHMLEAVRQHAPQAKMLVIGSAEEYGVSEQGELPMREDHPLRPINPYAVSKAAQDLLAYAYQVSYNLHLLRVRPFNHIGERQSPAFAVAAFAKQIVAIERGQQPTLKVGNLDGVRDFTDVKDMVRAYILVMEKGDEQQVYNIGSGVGVKMQAIVNRLIAHSSATITLETETSRLRPLDIPEIVCDNSTISALGWRPETSLEETLKRVLMYWRGEK